MYVFINGNDKHKLLFLIFSILLFQVHSVSSKDKYNIHAIEKKLGTQ